MYVQNRRYAMTNLTKVTMNLTERDVKNTENLRKKLHARNNTEAVCAAITITNTIADRVFDGDEILLKRRTGEVEKVIIPGLCA